MPKAAEPLLARIHPRAPSKGYMARTVVLSGSGYPKFDVDRGWYQIDRGIVPRLRALRNRPSDPSSPPIFQICTASEAKAVEKQEILEAAKADAPIPLPATRRRRMGRRAERHKDVAPERSMQPVDDRPRFIETADPNDPEDAEWLDDEDLAALEDLASDVADDDDELDYEPLPEKVVKKKTKKKATKKKATKKKAKKKASKKRSKKVT